MEGALLCCNDFKAAENSESSFSEGTTDTITSEAKCAMRATGTSQRAFIRNVAPESQLRPISPGCTEWWGGARGDVPASPAVEMEPIVTATTRCLRAVEGLSMGMRR